MSDTTEKPITYYEESHRSAGANGISVPSYEYEELIAMVRAREAVIDEVATIINPGWIERPYGRDLVLWARRHEDERFLYSKNADHLAAVTVSLEAQLNQQMTVTRTQEHEIAELKACALGPDISIQQLSEMRPKIMDAMRFTGNQLGYFRCMREALAVLPQPINQLVLAEREACAKICEKRAQARFDDHGTYEQDTGATYYTGAAADDHNARDEEDFEIADAIRKRSVVTEPLTGNHFDAVNAKGVAGEVGHRPIGNMDHFVPVEELIPEAFAPKAKAPTPITPGSCGWCDGEGLLGNTTDTIECMHCGGTGKATPEPEAFIPEGYACVSLEALTRIETGLSNFLFDATSSKAMQLNPHLADIRLMIAGATQQSSEALVRAEPADETGWLIEDYDHGLSHGWLRLIEDRYATGSKIRMVWVQSADTALRFSREEDAWLFASMQQNFCGICKITEHRFLTSALYAAPHTDAAPLIVPEGWKLTPIEPTEEMHSGLARDIMMWLDFSNKTSEQLFQHLENLGRSVPQWMQDEPELQALGHVPSKATRAVLIYKAMLADGPTFGDVTSADEGEL